MICGSTWPEDTALCKERRNRLFSKATESFQTSSRLVEPVAKPKALKLSSAQALSTECAYLMKRSYPFPFAVGLEISLLPLLLLLLLSRGKCSACGCEHARTHSRTQACVIALLARANRRVRRVHACPKPQTPRARLSTACTAQTPAVR